MYTSRHRTAIILNSFYWITTLIQFGIGAVQMPWTMRLRREAWYGVVEEIELYHY